MYKILITGGAGFVGSNLYPYLIDKKYFPLVYDLERGDDIFDYSIEEAIKQSDIVLHLAAATSVADSFKNPQETFRTNAIGTARIVELCIKYQKKLVYHSSAAIFEPDLSPYAHSKYVAEEIAKGAMGLTNITILRYVNIFGPHMNRRSGSMMYNFLNNKKIVVYGDGEQTRDFIHIRDVCSILEQSFSKEWNNKLINVGTGKSYSTNYIAGLFAYYRKLPVLYEPPKREMRWHKTDMSLLNELYKKPLTTNLEKDVEELCQMHSM